MVSDLTNDFHDFLRANIRSCNEKIESIDRGDDWLDSERVRAETFGEKTAYLKALSMFWEVVAR